MAFGVVVVFGFDLSGVLLGRQPFDGFVDFGHGVRASSASRRCETIHRPGDVLAQRLAAFSPCSEQVENYIGMKLAFFECMEEAGKPLNHAGFSGGEGGRKVAEVTAELGIGEQAVQRWRPTGCGRAAWHQLHDARRPKLLSRSAPGWGHFGAKRPERTLRLGCSRAT